MGGEILEGGGRERRPEAGHEPSHRGRAPARRQTRRRTQQEKQQDEASQNPEPRSRTAKEQPERDGQARDGEQQQTRARPGPLERDGSEEEGPDRDAASDPGTVRDERGDEKRNEQADRHAERVRIRERPGVASDAGPQAGREHRHRYPLERSRREGEERARRDGAKEQRPSGRIPHQAGESVEGHDEQRQHQEDTECAPIPVRGQHPELVDVQRSGPASHEQEESLSTQGRRESRDGRDRHEGKRPFPERRRQRRGLDAADPSRERGSRGRHRDEDERRRAGEVSEDAGKSREKRRGKGQPEQGVVGTQETDQKSRRDQEQGDDERRGWDRGRESQDSQERGGRAEGEDRPARHRLRTGRRPGHRTLRVDAQASASCNGVTRIGPPARARMASSAADAAESVVKQGMSRSRAVRRIATSS